MNFLYPHIKQRLTSLNKTPKESYSCYDVGFRLIKKYIFKKTIFLGGLFVFLTSFLVYFFTLAPTIVPGDGPELIAAAYNLGTAHPPGYPLLTLISKFFITVFPFGKIAWRVNLLNALFGSLAVAVVYLIIYKLTRKKVPAIAGALFLAFSSGFWFYSITAEVFALNNLFAVLLILIILIWREKVLKIKNSSSKWLYLFCFVAGLSFTNQQAIIFLAPAFLFLILATNWKVFINLKSLFFMALFLILGLIPYAYLFFASRFGSAFFYWGDPSNLKNFIAVLLRKGYGGIPYPKLEISLIGTWGRALVFYYSTLYYQFTLAGVFLGLLGFFSLWRREKIFNFLLIAFLFSGLLLLFYLGNLLHLEETIWKGISERFTLLSMVVFSIWIGLGIHCLIKIILSFLKSQSEMIKKLFVPIPILFCFLIPLFTHYSYVDQSDNYLLYDFGHDVLNAAEENALLVSQGDMMLFSTFFYLQNVEGVRTDIKIVHMALLGGEWYVNFIKERYPELKSPLISAENIKERSVYFPMINKAEELGKDYFLLPKRFLFQVFLERPSFTPHEYIEDNRQFYENSLLSKNPQLTKAKFNKKYPFTTWDSEIAYFYTVSHYNICNFLYLRSYYKEAERECEIALETNSDFSLAHLVLGHIAHKGGQYEMAINEYEKTIQLDPQNISAYESLIVIYTKYLKDEAKALEYTEGYLELKIKENSSK